jgi:hypothetical protein
MNRKDCAYLINSTPSYYYLLPLHMTLLKRYAPTCQWPIYLATEVPEHPMVLYLQTKWPDLKILSLTQDETMFFQCRKAAADRLPPEIQYVLPMQEDFLLEGRPIETVLADALQILDETPSILSLRLMPCPGPKAETCFGETPWRILDFAKDAYVFTYQATVWRREAYAEFFTELLVLQAKQFGTGLSKKQEIQIQVSYNLAEVADGQTLLRNKIPGLHLAWPREGKHPNAVYLSPWPYRPTAVVKGQLQDWAEELAHREDVPLQPSLR